MFKPRHTTKECVNNINTYYLVVTNVQIVFWEGQKVWKNNPRKFGFLISGWKLRPVTVESRFKKDFGSDQNLS